MFYKEVRSWTIMQGSSIKWENPLYGCFLHGFVGNPEQIHSKR
jgi:hypothetical protein